MKKYIALVTGGHDFDEDAFYGLFERLDGIAFDQMEYPQAEIIFDPVESRKYDAYVFYDCYQTIGEAAKSNWLDRLQEGKGCLFLHHSLTNHLDWDEYRHILGGLWKSGSYTIDGQSYGPPQWELEQRIDVSFPDPEHPIVSQMSPFSYLDETYLNYFIDPKVTPLLETSHPLSEKLIAWTHQYLNSRIAYIQPGGEPPVFVDPNYANLVRRAIYWVSGEDEVLGHVLN